MGIEKNRSTSAALIPFRPEIRFVDDSIVKHDTQVIHANSQIVGNLFLGNTTMKNGTAQIEAARHFKFARLTTVHAETITSTDVGIHRLRHKELSLQVIRKLIDVGKDTTEGAVRPECTTTFLDRLECLFLIVGRNGLFVFEKFILPNETRVRFAFPHGKRRSIGPDNTACGNIGTEHTGTDIDTGIQFLVDGRCIVVGRMVEQDAFIVVTRGLCRVLGQVIRINATQVEREHQIGKQRNVGVRHGHDVHVQDSVNACASHVIADPGTLFGIVEILQTESHVTGDCQWQIVLTQECGFHVAGKGIQRRIQGINLQLRRKSPRSTEARR